MHVFFDMFQGDQLVINFVQALNRIMVKYPCVWERLDSVDGPFFVDSILVHLVNTI